MRRASRRVTNEFQRKSKSERRYLLTLLRQFIDTVMEAGGLSVGVTTMRKRPSGATAYQGWKGCAATIPGIGNSTVGRPNSRTMVLLTRAEAISFLRVMKKRSRPSALQTGR